jgi:hypothetical protein
MGHIVIHSIQLIHCEWRTHNISDFIRNINEHTHLFAGPHQLTLKSDVEPDLSMKIWSINICRSANV